MELEVRHDVAHEGHRGAGLQDAPKSYIRFHRSSPRWLFASSPKYLADQWTVQFTMELASGFYSSGPRGYVTLLAQHLSPASGLVQAEALPLAEALFGLLLGEPHRRRLLGLAPAPSAAAARAHAEQVITLLGLTERPRDDG